MDKSRGLTAHMVTLFRFLKPLNFQQTKTCMLFREFESELIALQSQFIFSPALTTDRIVQLFLASLHILEDTESSSESFDCDSSEIF